jgi:dihydrofolate synthase/folylpolyglutamate synthase
MPVDRAFFVPETRLAVNYQDSIDWLYSTQTFGIKLGLENMGKLLHALDLTENRVGRKIIHVAGTNGKGSVCAFSERILRDAGVITGLFTSPHLITYRERVRVNGIPIDEETVARILTEIRGLVHDWEPHPTFFEISFALAMRHFGEQGCEVILLETGMGGRLDATNALRADVSVISSISLDHQQWLGETIREIAGEKAGILKVEVPVVVADLPPDARDVVGRRALTLGIPCIEVHPLPEEWPLGLRGPHQRENAALAVEAVCRVEGGKLTQDGIRQSLAATQWPGRFQQVAEDVILDGAHNPDAALALRETWMEVFPGKKANLVFGAVGSKDVVRVFEALLPILSSLVLVPVKSERRLTVGEMKAALNEAGGAHLPVREAATLPEAIESSRRKEGTTLVAGSLFLVGEALGYFLGEQFEVSLQ